MRVDFAKMHGNGNDFVVIDDSRGSIGLSGEQARRLADRHLGVGCDQVLVARPPNGAGADVAMQIFNSDGSAARQCGNGLRCFARFVRAAGLVARSPVRVATPGGVVSAFLLPDGDVRADMGTPRFEPAQVPLVAPARARRYSLDVGGEEVVIGAVSMGNPHAVLAVDEVAAAPVTRLGPAIQALDRFPEGVNVGFMQVLDRGHIRLRVYERGAGETLACGSGACAAVAVGRDQGLLDATVRVDLPGGSLRVEWTGEEGELVWMTGPAAHVFDGAMDV